MTKGCPVIFGIITFVILCAGAFTPGWIVWDMGDIQGVKDHDTSKGVTVHFGLFYMLINGEDFSGVYGYSSDIRGGSGIFALTFLEYQIEVILGLILCLISVIMTCFYNKNSSPGLLMAPAIMYMIAGFVTLIAVGRCFYAVTVLARVIDKGINVPYSIILSGIGGISLGILSIINYVMFCKHNNNRTPQGGVVFSDLHTVSYPQVGHPPPDYSTGQTKTGYVNNHMYPAKQ